MTELEIVTVEDINVGDILVYNPDIWFNLSHVHFLVTKKHDSFNDFEAEYYSSDVKSGTYILGPADVNGGTPLRRKIVYKEIPYDPDQLIEDGDL